MDYRTTKITYEDGETSHPRTIRIEPAEVADHCHGGPSVRELIAERIREHGETGSPVVDFDFHEVTHTRLVGVVAFTVGEVDRCYGGPEEGGWYYDHFEPARVFYVSKAKADRLQRLLQAWCDARAPKHKWAHDPHWAVRSGVESATHRPHYC